MPDPILDTSLPAGSPEDRAPRREEAHDLLRSCFEAYSQRLTGGAYDSLEMASDLFDSTTAVPDGEIATFRTKRPEWLDRFERTLAESFENWLKGSRRRGRRPDKDASAATLSVMTPFDQEKQAALVEATAFLFRFTKRESAALDARVSDLVPGPSREQDNPFGPEYILDALGVTSRAVYPSPRVWRPLMVRLLADLSPAINKIYISLNRTLADRGVLPDMKASLRARSDFRPADDKDLLPTFSKMLADVGALPTDVVVPDATATTEDGKKVEGSASAATLEAALVNAPAPAIAPPSPAILAGLATLAELGKRAGAGATAPPPSSTGDFPDLDPMMALGSSTPLFATLGEWQRLDLSAALLQAMPAPAPGDAAPEVPQNLVPHINAAVAPQIENASDRIAMDVIALLFDYVFRDPSIPDRQRRLFGRLQVPIVKAALLDRTFFSDRRHPARALLDHLAEGAIGANAEDAYGDAFEKAATDVVEGVCRDFEIDVGVFARGDAQLAAFLDAERREAAPALSDQVAVALAAEEGEGERAQVRALVRDKLAGLELPFQVRTFAETIWADYLTTLRKSDGANGDGSQAALGTLDELLWSIEVKERTAQKARLTKMIPGLISGLRRGCAAVTAPDDRAKPFFEALYALHMAALKPAPEAAAKPTAPARPATAVPSPPPAPVSPVSPVAAVAKAAPAPAAAKAPAVAATGSLPNVHDFVSEMAVGTWLTFGDGAAAVNARLSWVSPLRSKYVFTSRSRTKAYVFAPEELAHELGSGRASLVVEPVPLFDRAVSAALDTLAARKPPARVAA
jgi:uncharacterized protein DUF1631